MIGREAFQEIDLPRMFGPITKWAIQINDAAGIPEIVARAFDVATAGRPGPVVLALPEGHVGRDPSPSRMDSPAGRLERRLARRRCGPSVRC